MSTANPTSSTQPTPTTTTANSTAFSLDASEQKLLDEFGVLHVAAEYTYGA